MSVSGISSQSTYAALSSGYRINSAADDAAGLAISEDMLSEKNGYHVGTDNAADGRNLLNVADGALSGMQDSLQRIRELALQATNGIYGSSEKQAIQSEIDQLKETIQATAKGTSFNSLKLLDGSLADIQLATNPEGGGMEIQLANATLEALGIADFDVTGSYNITDIDNAIEKISSARSSFGAQTNALEHTMNFNQIASIDMASSRSRIKDTDYGEEIIKKKRDEAMEQYRMFAINAKKKEEEGVLRLFK